MYKPLFGILLYMQPFRCINLFYIQNMVTNRMSFSDCLTDCHRMSELHGHRRHAPWQQRKFVCP